MLYFSFWLIDIKSFESIENWRNQFLIQLCPKEPETFPFVLLGNKSDKINDKKVQESKIKQYCELKGNIPYFETSAKDSTNVEDAFQEVARLAFKRNYKEGEILFIPDRVELKNTANRTQQNNCCWIDHWIY